MKVKLKSLLTIACLLGSGLTQAADDNPGDGKRGNDCLFNVTIDDWRALDSKHLLIWGPGRTAYLAEFMGSMSDLPFTETLAVIDKDHDGRLCPGDEITVPHSPTSFPMMISSLRRLSSDDLKALGERYHLQLVPKTKQHDKQAHEQHSSN